MGHRQAAVAQLHRTVGNHALSRLFSASLPVGSPSSRHEDEADRVAETVTRSATSSGDAHTSPEGAVLALVEDRTGADLGDVRFHAGPQAADAARALQARAFAVGRDVVFGAGQYRPGDREGRRLIAHELAHVVQQGGGVPGHGLSRAATLVQRQPDPAAAALDAAQRAQAINAALHDGWWPDGEGAVAQLRGQPPEMVREIRRQYEALSGGLALEAELRGATNAAQWQEALNALLPALSLEARLRLNIEGHAGLGLLAGLSLGLAGASVGPTVGRLFTTENERAMIKMIETASVEERMVAVDGADSADVAALLEASLSWDQLYEARKLLMRGLPNETSRLETLVKNRIREAHGYVQDDEAAVYDALLDLPPRERHELWQSQRGSETGLFAFLDEQEKEAVAILCGEGQQAALTERMRLATQGAGTDDPGVAAALAQAVTLGPEARASLVTGPFMEMVHGDVAAEEFQSAGAALGADPTAMAKQAIIDAGEVFGGGAPVVQRVIEELATDPDTRQSARALLDDPDVAFALRQLSNADLTMVFELASGDSYRIAVAKLRRAKDAVRPDKAAVIRVLLGMSKADRERLSSEDGPDRDLYEQLLEQDSWIDRDLSEIAARLIEAPESAAPVDAVVDWALQGREPSTGGWALAEATPLGTVAGWALDAWRAADPEVLTAAFAAMNDSERYSFRLGYFLARGGAVDAGVASPDEQEAARERFETLEAALVKQLGTDDLQLTLDALVGEPSVAELLIAPELTAGVERQRAADKGALRADESWTSLTSRGLMDTVSETGPIADQAQARLDAAYRRALAEGGISLDELVEIRRLGSAYAAAYGEHVAATEQVRNLASTAAAVAVGVLVAAGSGGTLGPAVAAALGGGNLGVAALIGGGAVAATRVGVSEIAGGIHYDALSEEGARDALAGLTEGAANVLAAGLVARFSSLVGAGGPMLGERLATATVAAGEAGLPAAARSATTAAGRSAIEAFLSGAVGDLVLTASDEKVWRQSIDEVIAELLRSVPRGGLPAAAGGALVGGLLEALAGIVGVVKARRLITALNGAGVDTPRLEGLPLAARRAIGDADAAFEAGRLEDAAQALSELSGEIDAEEVQRIWNTLGRRHLGADPPPITGAPEPPPGAAAEPLRAEVTPANASEPEPTPVANAESATPVTDVEAPATGTPDPVVDMPAAAPETPAPVSERPSLAADAPAPVADTPTLVGGPLPGGSPSAPARLDPIAQRSARSVFGGQAVRTAASRIEAEQRAAIGGGRRAIAEVGGGADILGWVLAERARRLRIRGILQQVRQFLETEAGGDELLRSIRASPRQRAVTKFQSLGRPGGILQGVRMRGVAITEWLGSVIGAKSAKIDFPGGGARYPDIAAELAGWDDRVVARDLRELMSGGTVPEERVAMVTHLAYLMFGRESARRPANVAHAAMTIQLIERGEMTFAEAFSSFEPMPGVVRPPGGGGAYPVSRVAKGLRPAEVEEETLRRETALAGRWLASEARHDQVQLVELAGTTRVLTPEFDGPRDLEEYVTRKLREFYGLDGTE